MKLCHVQPKCLKVEKHIHAYIHSDIYLYRYIHVVYAISENLIFYIKNLKNKVQVKKIKTHINNAIIPYVYCVSKVL